MPFSLIPIGNWLHARAENILAAMLATMFIVFIIQIVFRYVFNLPTGWAHEISVVMWVWIVLFGTSFVVRDSEEIRFDFLYGSVGPGVRRGMILITALTLVALFAISLPAVVDYIMFMKVEKTAYLKIRFDYLYSIYAVFAVAMIVRQLYYAFQAIRGDAGDDVDPTKASSGI